MNAATGKCYYVFVLGAPGAGKGTLCRKMAADPDFKHHNICHLSVGDCLREMDMEGSLSSKAAEAFAEQSLIPAEDLLPILYQEMFHEWTNGHNLILLDGFPGELDQMQPFLELYAVEFAIFIDCEEEVALERYLDREDPLTRNDNERIFRKRYAEFARNNPDVIEPFELSKRLVTINSSAPAGFDEDALYGLLKNEMLQNTNVRDFMTKKLSNMTL